MLHKTFTIPPTVSEYGATLTVYIQDTPKELLIQQRPIILICPGGGYSQIVVRESELLAIPFLGMGYHAAVLHYSVEPVHYPAQLKEAAYSIGFLREHAREFCIDPDKIIILGGSAGGHLAACTGVFWHHPWLSEAVGMQNPQTIKPNGMILCYPVITSGPYRNIGSFESLLGENPDPNLWELLSLEHQVTEHTPPAFLWHTLDDTVVPVENSLLFVSALRQHAIPAELHIYPHGIHGLSLANKQTAAADGRLIEPQCASWVSLAHTWMDCL